MTGGGAWRATDSPTGLQYYAWKPGGSEIAFAADDEPANKAEIEKGNDAFEVGNNDFLAGGAPQPGHAWLVSADGGHARRLTSRTWGPTTVPPPAPPPSPPSWSAHRQATPIV